MKIRGQAFKQKLTGQWLKSEELKYFGNDESTESYLSHIEETIKRIAKEERPKLKRKAKEERQKKKRKN